MYKVDEDVALLQRYVETTNYVNLHSDYPNTCSSSTDLNILNKFNDIKLNFLSYFNDFKNNVLAYHHTSFTITTSWSTKCEFNQNSHFHTHKNSFYSSVFYFEDCIEGGNIEFDDNIRPCSFLINAHHPTYETGSRYTIKPTKGLLVFFPSYLRHRIALYKGNIPRYSLAFNIVPVGHYGTGDSSIITTIDM